MVTMPNTAEVSRRQLHIVFVLDRSGSMAGEKIASLNYAVRNAIPAMQEVAAERAECEIFVRALAFSDGAQWHINPSLVENFEWRELSADGATDMGAAMKMIASQLTVQNLPGRQLPPLLILVSDGQPTDNMADGLKALLSSQYGSKSVRIAIAIGADADLSVMQSFIGNNERKPLRAGNSDDLVKFIRWASTSAMERVSANKASDLNGNQPSDSVEMVW